MKIRAALIVLFFALATEICALYKATIASFLYQSSSSPDFADMAALAITLVIFVIFSPVLYSASDTVSKSPMRKIFTVKCDLNK